MNRPAALTLLIALLAWGAESAARADRLVTRDGSIIETRGPWEVRGKLVVFKLADGTLASLRLSEADLEASAELARAAEERARQASRQAAEPPAAKPEAAMVLTDMDVAHVDGEEPESEGGPDDEPPAGQSPVAGSGRGVQVVQWSQESDADAGTVELKGVVQNLGSSITTNLSVNVLFYDQAGGLLAAREAPLDGVVLRPAARQEFSVPLPHTLVYDEVKFQVTGRGFRTRSQSARPPGAEAPPADEP